MKKQDDLNVRLLSMLSYIGPLFIIGKFAVEKDSPDVKFHINQGKYLFFLMASIMLLTISLDFLITSFSELGYVIFLLAYIGESVAWIILSFMGIVGSIKKNKIQLPIIYDIAKKFN